MRSCARRGSARSGRSDSKATRRHVPRAVPGRTASKDWLKYTSARPQPSRGWPIERDRRADRLALAGELPEKIRHGSHPFAPPGARRRVSWQWIERNVARTSRIRCTRGQEFSRSTRGTRSRLSRDELGPFGPFVIFSVGTGVRPRRRSGRVGRRRPAGGVLAFTALVRQGPAQAVRQDGALAAAHPAAREGDRGAGDHPRSRGHPVPRVARAAGSTSTTGARANGCPRSAAAGVEHRRIYDMRHTFATWSLAAGMSIFTLARRMGTSVQMIDADLRPPGARRRGPGPRPARRLRPTAVGTLWARLRTQPTDDAPRTKKAPRMQGFRRSAPERIRTSDLRFRRPTLYPAELRALVALRPGSVALARPGTGPGASANWS